MSYEVISAGFPAARLEPRAYGLRSPGARLHAAARYAMANGQWVSVWLCTYITAGEYVPQDDLEDAEGRDRCRACIAAVEAIDLANDRVPASGRPLTAKRLREGGWTIELKGAQLFVGGRKLSPWMRREIRLHADAIAADEQTISDSHK